MDELDKQVKDLNAAAWKSKKKVKGSFFFPEINKPNDGTSLEIFEAGTIGDSSVMEKAMKSEGPEVVVRDVTAEHGSKAGIRPDPGKEVRVESNSVVHRSDIKIT